MKTKQNKRKEKKYNKLTKENIIYIELIIQTLKKWKENKTKQNKTKEK